MNGLQRPRERLHDRKHSKAHFSLPNRTTYPLLRQLPVRVFRSQTLQNRLAVRCPRFRVGGGGVVVAEAGEGLENNGVLGDQLLRKKRKGRHDGMDLGAERKREGGVRE